MSDSTNQTPNSSTPKSTLLIGCGALAREILTIIKLNKLDHMQLICLPAHFHNTPQKIVPGVVEKIKQHKDRFDRIIVLYGDCGTGGELDGALESLDVERIPGPHCYSFFATESSFDDLMEQELGTFFLTDYLAQHFDKLIIEGMGIHKHPELQDMMFGHYSKLVYLAQSPTDALVEKAKAAATRLGLTFEQKDTGYGELNTFLAQH